MSSVIDSMRDDSGRLPAFAWPGGYPIVYLTWRDSPMCADCANVGPSEFNEPPVACGLHMEGEPIECEECGKEIESAYGVPK